MAIHEQLLKTAIDAVIEAHGEAIRDILGVELESPSVPIPRVLLAEARELFKEAGYEIPRADGGLGTEAERQLEEIVEARPLSAVDFSWVNGLRFADNPREEWSDFATLPNTADSDQLQRISTLALWLNTLCNAPSRDPDAEALLDGPSAKLSGSSVYTDKQSFSRK